jgi:hypothetical protein
VPEIVAVFTGAVAVLLVVGLLHGTSGTRKPGAARTRSSPTALSRTPSGAVRAATTYLLALSKLEMGSSASAKHMIASIVVGPLQAKLEQALPLVVSRIRARLASADAPAEFDGWPLGYRVDAFQPGVATISIWHLDTAATSALGLAAADYTTTTYTIAWIAGIWRIRNVKQAGGPAPPGSRASASRVDTCERAVSRFSRYTYVP